MKLLSFDWNDFLLKEVEKSADTTIIMLERPLMITASSSGNDIKVLHSRCEKIKP